MHVSLINQPVSSGQHVCVDESRSENASRSLASPLLVESFHSASPHGGISNRTRQFVDFMSNGRMIDRTYDQGPHPVSEYRSM